MTVFIGVDAGGTSTRAVLVDGAGRCLGYGTAGGGNPVSWGPAQAADAIGAAIQRAADGARRDGLLEADTGPGVAVLAMAGANAMLSPESMIGDLHGIGRIGRVDIASDLLATFCSGTPARSGYVLVAGTGSAALRVDDGQIAASADGLGWLIGDAGSGFWIGCRVVRSALAALDGYGPPTALAALLGSELGLPGGGDRTPLGRLSAVESAVDMIYQMRPVELARFASLAFRAAGVAETAPTGDISADADPVAATILTQARERLLCTLGAVWAAGHPGPVVVGGSIAQRLPGLAVAITAAAAARGEAAPAITAVPDGVIGAAVLAMRAAGIEVDAVVFDRLTGSLAEHR